VSDATAALPLAHLDVAETDEVALQASLHARDLTDGLPVVVPTEARVRAFLDAAGRDPADVVGVVPPQQGEATVAGIAVNALMAGCRPEHLDLVIAALTAMLQPQFRLVTVQVTTNPVAPLMIVNGPIRKRLGIASGRNALSPGQAPNGVIGRAVRLVLRNIGGAWGDADRATLGSPAKYTYCLAEAEESSPWEPLHVSLGYAATDDVVTMVGVESFIDTIPVFQSADPIIDHFARAIRAGGTNVYWSKGSLVMVVNPGHARILAAEGHTRRSLQERLFEQGMIPLSDLPHGNIPQGEWVVVDGKVRITSSPDEIYIVVAGGPEPLHSVYMTGLGVCNAASARVRRAAASA
jgi:hypothetical protein